MKTLCIEQKSSRLHLIAHANRAVIEAEEVYELMQELADTDSGGIHRAAQSLRETRKLKVRKTLRFCY